MSIVNTDKRLGNYIRTLRSNRKLTQEDVARQLGISEQKYAQIENGNKRIGLDVLSPLAKIFDVTVMDITNVLEQDRNIENPHKKASSSVQKIFDMLDLFYANKHLCQQIQSGYKEVVDVQK